MSTQSEEPGSSSEGRPDLTPDRYAESLQPGGGGRRAAAVPFVGLLADDDDPEYVRIYQDYELRTCVRVRRDTVRKRERVRNSAGVEVSLILVDSQAQVEILEVSSEQMQADMLSRALLAAESGALRAGPGLATPTITTVTPPISAAICTRIFCTNITCGCTSRHSTLCSITCSDHPLCPNPWTENWFCASQ